MGPRGVQGELLGAKCACTCRLPHRLPCVGPPSLQPLPAVTPCLQTSTANSVGQRARTTTDRSALQTAAPPVTPTSRQGGGRSAAGCCRLRCLRPSHPASASPMPPAGCAHAADAVPRPAACGRPGGHLPALHHLPMQALRPQGGRQPGAGRGHLVQPRCTMGGAAWLWWGRGQQVARLHDWIGDCSCKVPHPVPRPPPPATPPEPPTCSTLPNNRYCAHCPADPPAAGTLPSVYCVAAGGTVCRHILPNVSDRGVQRARPAQHGLTCSMASM